MTPEQQLLALVNKGAGFTSLASGMTLPLAAARFLSGRVFWYCLLCPENDFAQHREEFHRMESAGTNINLYGNGGQIIGTIAPLEPEERRAARWEEWLRDDPATRSSHDFVQKLEEDAAQEPQ